MPVDVEQAGAVFGLVHQMIVPDFVVQRRRFGHERKLQREKCERFGARSAGRAISAQHYAAHVSSEVAEVANRPKKRPGSRERSSITTRWQTMLVGSRTIPKPYSTRHGKREGFAPRKEDGVATKKRGVSPRFSSNRWWQRLLVDGLGVLGLLDDAGRLAAQVAQVIELGATHLAAAHDLDRVDHRRH